RGHIVNLLDARMTDYDRNHLSYHLSKRSLHDMTRIMSIEFAPLIQVNAVAPGMVLFPEDRVGNLAGKALKAGLLDTLPSPEDIVHSVLYLLSSPALTGQVIFPDSGRNLRGSVYG
ncbi:MAG: SDR family oxidoreductase, partial [Spirochaetales bacterium]